MEERGSGLYFGNDGQEVIEIIKRIERLYRGKEREFPLI